MRSMLHRVPGRPSRTHLLLAVLALLGMFLTACSQDAAESTDDASAPAETSSQAADSGGEGGEDVAGADLDGDFCDLSRQAEELVMNDSGVSSLEEATAQSEEFAALYQALAEKAPPEIADDVRTVSDSVTKPLEALDEINLDPDNPDAALEAAERAADAAGDVFSAEVMEAQTRIAQWEAENC